MAVNNHDGSNKDTNWVKAKSEETERLSSRNTDASLVKSSSGEKGTRYHCKECGKQMINQGNFNAHIRAMLEGKKYSCRQCQHEATSKNGLANTEELYMKE